jgi:hypothetical protein
MRDLAMFPIRKGPAMKLFKEAARFLDLVNSRRTNRNKASLTLFLMIALSNGANLMLVLIQTDIRFG